MKTIIGVGSERNQWYAIICAKYWNNYVVSGLRQFLVTESPLKVMKNTFPYTL